MSTTKWKIKVKWSAGHNRYYAWARPKTFRGWVDSLKVSPQLRLLGSGYTAEEAIADVKKDINRYAPITGTGKFTYTPDSIQ